MNKNETVVISGSASLQPEMKKWLQKWESMKYNVLDWPKPIEKEKFTQEWPIIHQEFYQALEKTDIHFIANEDKNNEKGYIGNGVFAEISFSAGLNLVREKKIKIILLQEVAKENKFYSDIELWMKMGWLDIFNPALFKLKNLK